MATKGHNKRNGHLGKAPVREMAERLIAFGFCLFFVLGGAGFTLSHYCCGQCRVHHCGTEWAQQNEAGMTLSAHENRSEHNPTGCTERKTQIGKACGCCFVRHFEIDTTETGQPQALPAAQELVLFCQHTPNPTERTATLSETDATEHPTSPPIRYTGGKTVLQQVCRWVI